MSIWDKFKSVLGLGPGPEVRRKRVEAAVLALAQAGRCFTPLEVANLATEDGADRRPALLDLEYLAASGFLKPLGYTRTLQPSPVGTWVYHPLHVDPSGYVPEAAVAGLGPVAEATTDRFQNPALFGLSEEELAKRSTQLDPTRVRWTGGRDSLPAATDESTRAIDQGLVLRGLLTEEQVAEVHRVGAAWGRHKDQEWFALALAARTADEAVERLRRERAEHKAEKQRLAAQRAEEHREAVARRRLEDIVHLGRGVSQGLADRKSDPQALRARGLPVLSTPADVAQALGLTVPRLRWLAYHSEAAERTHYVFFEVPKRSGGTRLLAAPHEELAKAQAWILTNVLERLPTEPPAHGFVKGRSTVTNAAPHLGRELVVNLDLADFFPSITFPRVRGVFQKLGYSPAVATVLALLTTECPRRRVEYEGTAYQVAVGPRGLPQGACTSPALSNQVSRKLDRRLAGMARKRGFTYTRYADDLTFSTDADHLGDVPRLLASVRHIVEEEGFAIQVKKGRVQRRSGRQSVTGVVVNDKPGVPREEVRALRALLHNARKTGLSAQNRDQRPGFEAHVRGRIAYVTMVDREKGLALLRQLEALPR